ALGGRAAVEGVILSVAGLRSPLGAGLLPAPPLLPAIMGRGSRVANQPARRLAGAAVLFDRAASDLPAFALSSALSDAAHLLAAWSVGPPTASGAALIGAERAAEIAINAVLPF